eukprot:TRINITY_DN8747_c0_g1_i1.p1 TRINITY_DN8747_c0_g1~~TRINITY_DN8747_c0_g1_i1.p1  ORF type:complete len:300 (-),score=106.46 TRINITY_DN8747_c0_g1_i1:97-996(-)
MEPLNLQGKIDNSFEAHSDSVWSVCWFSDTLSTGSIDETVKIWNKEWKNIETLEDHSWGVVSIAYNQKTNSFAVSSIDSKIKVRSAENYAIKKIFNAYPVETWSIAFHPDGELLASSSKLGNVNIWSLATGKYEPINLNSTFSMCVRYNQDGSLIAASSANNSISIIDTTRNTKVKNFKTPASNDHAIRQVKFNQNINTFFAASDDSNVYIFDVRQESHIGVLTGHSSWALCVDSTSDINFVITGSSDSKIKTWDTRTQKSIETIEIHKDQVWDLAFDPITSKLASCSDDGTVAIHSFK